MYASYSTSVPFFKTDFPSSRLSYDADSISIRTKEKNEPLHWKCAFFSVHFPATDGCRGKTNARELIVGCVYVCWAHAKDQQSREREWRVSACTQTAVMTHQRASFNGDSGEMGGFLLALWQSYSFSATRWIGMRFKSESVCVLVYVVWIWAVTWDEPRHWRCRYFYGGRHASALLCIPLSIKACFPPYSPPPYHDSRRCFPLLLFGSLCAGFHLGRDPFSEKWPPWLPPDRTKPADQVELQKCAQKLINNWFRAILS